MNWRCQILSVVRREQRNAVCSGSMVALNREQAAGQPARQGAVVRVEQQRNGPVVCWGCGVAGLREGGDDSLQKSSRHHLGGPHRREDPGQQRGNDVCERLVELGRYSVSPSLGNGRGAWR
jgi:hypothetical protein